MDIEDAPKTKSFRLPLYTLEQLEGLLEAKRFRTATEVIVVAIDNLSLVDRMRGTAEPQMTPSEGIKYLIEGEIRRTIKLFETYGDDNRKYRVLDTLNEGLDLLSQNHNYPEDISTACEIFCNAYKDNYDFEVDESFKKMEEEDYKKKKSFYEELNREIEKINTFDISEEEKAKLIAQTSQELLNKYRDNNIVD